MQQLQLKRIEAGFTWLQNEFEHTGEIQSVDLLIQKLDVINSYMSWSSEQMAIAKKSWNEAIVKAHEVYYVSSRANNFQFSPINLKNYLAGKCANEEYAFDMAERLSRCLVHIAENLRTSISALKQSMMLESYAQRVPN